MKAGAFLYAWILYACNKNRGKRHVKEVFMGWRDMDMFVGGISKVRVGVEKLVERTFEGRLRDHTGSSAVSDLRSL